MMQAYFGGLDTAFQSMDPIYKAAARSGLEFVGLASLRAQAHVDIPSQMVECRTVQDVTSAQMRFWQTAAQHYQDSTRHIMSIWAAAVPTTSAFGSPDARTRQRDYITLPDDHAASAHAATDRRPTARTGASAADDQRHPAAA